MKVDLPLLLAPTTANLSSGNADGSRPREIAIPVDETG